MFSPELKLVEQYAETIGTAGAIRLSAFFGGSGRHIYCPTTADDQAHILCKLLGADAFQKLVAHYGGQRLRVPSLEIEHLRRAGKVWMLKQNNVSTAGIAHLLGISAEHARRIADEIRRAGFEGIANDLGGDHV